jgi:proteasome lid subunit RPN8/RPN11
VVVIVTAEELETVREHAVREYPRESCGVILTRGAERRLMACRNVQDELHARDPERHPRDARTAYYIDPVDLLGIGRLEANGFVVSVIYHSHVDAGAYFSDTDKRNALMADEPAYPGVTYFVTAVMQGALQTTAAFRWDASRRDFLPVALDVTASKAQERSA